MASVRNEETPPARAVAIRSNLPPAECCGRFYTRSRLPENVKDYVLRDAAKRGVK